MGNRNVTINGRQFAIPVQTTVRELRQIANIPPNRLIAEVRDTGTMRKLNDTEVIDPQSEGVYTVFPNFQYG